MMGTNYNAHLNRCDCCERVDVVHIGKSMTTFRAYLPPSDWDELPAGLDTPIETWADWLALLADGTVPIHDEYGDEVGEGYERAAWLARWTPHPEAVPGWIDEFGFGFDADGHRFGAREFS